MGFGKDGKGVMIRNTDTITLLTLGSLAVEIQDSPLVMSDSFRMLKTEGSYSLECATFIAGDGPIDLYLVSTALTAVEIAAAIAADGPLSREDTVLANTAMRPVFKLTDSPIPFRPPAVTADEPIGAWSRPMRWTYGDGGSTGSFGVAAFNLGMSALTTGGQVRFTAIHYGVWVGA